MDYLVHHLFFPSLEKNPHKTAVKDNTSSLTYEELSGRAGSLAVQLTEAGIRKGDRAVFYLDQNVDQAAAILGISSTGGVFIPISILLQPEQVAFIIKDSRSRFLITTRQKHNAIACYLEDCSFLEHIIYIDTPMDPIPLKRTSLCIENDLAALLYTSGSTGFPKGVMISHKNLVAGCHIVSEYLDIRESDRLLGVLQVSFDYGLNQLITMLAKGGTYRFLRYKFPNDIVRALSEDEITGFAGIPPIWAFLVRSSLADTSLPHLRYITNSGGAVPLYLLDFLRNALPDTKIVLMYGLTEAFRSTYLPPSELDKRPNSMGKAIPDTDIYVVSEKGEFCTPDEVGELVHRGPTVSLGYWNRPEDTKLRFRPFVVDKETGTTEQVVFSGDLVRKDKEGYLYFVGRKDNMIKCYGVRVSPMEVEEVVYKSGMVKEAAAVGVPDTITGTGHHIKIYVVPDDIYKYREEEFTISLRRYCNEHLPQYMVPRYVEIMAELPKNSTGKINYPALKAQHEKETIARS